MTKWRRHYIPPFHFMEKFLSSAAFLFLVTGLFTACQSPAEAPLPDGEVNTSTSMGVTVEGSEEDDMEVTVDEVTPGESSETESKPSAPVETPTSSSTKPSAPVETPAEAVSAFKDGTYTASRTYDSPAGLDEIHVKVTIKNDIITAVSSSATAANEVSLRFQENFGSAIQGLVVGKSLSDLGSFNAVSGASLTTPAFNAALNVIRGQARA